MDCGIPTTAACDGRRGARWQARRATAGVRTFNRSYTAAKCLEQHACALLE